MCWRWNSCSASHPHRTFRAQLNRDGLGGETAIRNNAVVLPARVQIVDRDLLTQLEGMPVGVELGTRSTVAVVRLATSGSGKSGNSFTNTSWYDRLRAGARSQTVPQHRGEGQARRRTNMWRVSAVLLAAGLVCGMAVWWSRAGSPDTPYHPVAGAEGVTGESHREIEPSSPAVWSRPTGRRASPDTAQASSRTPSTCRPPCGLGPVGQQDVSSQVDGVIREVLVDLGQRVTRGEVLGRLDDRQLRPAGGTAAKSGRQPGGGEDRPGDVRRGRQQGRLALKANKSGLKAVSDLEYQTYLFQRQRFLRR